VSGDEGWIILEGEVDWTHLKETAEAALGRLAGVRSVTNQIRARPHLTPTEPEAPVGIPMRQSAWPCPGPAEEETEESWEIVQGNGSCWVQDQAADPLGRVGVTTSAGRPDGGGLPGTPDRPAPKRNA
jgi:BON domain-containing protein